MEDRKLSCLHARVVTIVADDGDDGDGGGGVAPPRAVVGEGQAREKAFASVKSGKRIQRDSEGSNDGSFSLIRLKRRVVTAFYSTA